jgi:hypothetical protein
MHHAEVLVLECNQLAAERQWLGQRHPRTEIADCIESALAHPDLTIFIGKLEKRNRALAANRERRRNRSPFLLAPYLLHIIHSVQARKFARAAMPVLDGPAAEVSSHFKEVSAKAKALAAILRRGPQPTVLLGAPDEVSRAAALSQAFPVLQSTSRSNVHVLLHNILDDASKLFDDTAGKIGRAKQHRRLTYEQELRARTVSVLIPTFREQLGQPYFAHVAIIAQILSGIETDVEYVKKTDNRKRRTVTGDSLPPKS